MQQQLTQLCKKTSNVGKCIAAREQNMKKKNQINTHKIKGKEKIEAQQNWQKKRKQKHSQQKT